MNERLGKVGHDLLGSRGKVTLRLAVALLLARLVPAHGGLRLALPRAT